MCWQNHPRRAEDAGALLRPDPSAWTRLWQRGAISNFDYLMRLNSLSGRTYSDLTQYPVMPWVLSDYTSEAIDLRDPRHYRDLSRPIGALNPANRPRLQETYQTLKETYEEVCQPASRWVRQTHQTLSEAFEEAGRRVGKWASSKVASRQVGEWVSRQVGK